MGTVMIRCPRTGRAIPTGFVADSREFRRKPVFVARTYCAACRAEHEFFAREAWVDENDGARPEAA
jgi:hypothetical protein